MKIFANHVSDKWLKSIIYKAPLQLYNNNKIIQLKNEQRNLQIIKKKRMADKFMKRYATSLILREMQVKSK